MSDNDMSIETAWLALRQHILKGAPTKPEEVLGVFRQMFYCGFWSCYTKEVPGGEAGLAVQRDVWAKEFNEFLRMQP